MALDEQSLILTSLGLAGWRRETVDAFVPVGALPSWWFELSPGDSTALVPTKLDYDFLNNFLIDAEVVWSGNRAEKIESGIWEHELESGGYLLLQVHAIKSAEGDFLVFQDLDATDTVWRDMLQSGRQSQLRLLRDISQRKQLELELRRAKDTAERLEQAKMEFFAKTNHEIRTPLASILAMTEMALETELDEAQQDYLSATRKSAETLLRIMNDVLDFSKIEHGSLSIDCTRFTISEMWTELNRDFEPAAVERGIALSTQAEGSIEMCTDAVRLRQVLNNLVHNALRFTDEGSVTITAEMEKTDRLAASPNTAEAPYKDGDRIRFAVSDTGCGIPPDQQQRIFESFVQGDKDAGLQRGGTGLGLSIASKLVELMGGGPLQLESTVGGGTTFWFVLPRVLESEAARPATTPTAGQSIDLGVLEGLTVLVAEDNPVNRAYACHVLSAAGCGVIEAEDGHEAVAQWRQQSPDVVLMDCRMPDCDGVQATSRIRQQESEAGGHVPIVAVTAHSMAEDVDRCLSAGMDDYISKPFKKAELLQKVAGLVRHAAS